MSSVTRCDYCNEDIITGQPFVQVTIQQALLRGPTVDEPTVRHYHDGPTADIVGPYPMSAVRAPACWWTHNFGPVESFTPET